MNLKLNIAYNKRTKQLVGYTNPNKDGFSILVKAYSVDDLKLKFNKAVDKHKKREQSRNTVSYLQTKDEDEINRMIHHNM